MKTQPLTWPQFLSAFSSFQGPSTDIIAVNPHGKWWGEGGEKAPKALVPSSYSRGTRLGWKHPGEGLQRGPAPLPSASSTTPVLPLQGGSSGVSSICPSLWSLSRLWPQHLHSYTHPDILSGSSGCILSDVNLSNLSKTQNRPCLKWSESRSVESNSLRPHGPYSPWNSPGQNTGVGSLSLLQGIFRTQGSNPVSRIAGGFFTSWATREEAGWDGPVLGHSFSSVLCLASKIKAVSFCPNKIFLFHT